MKKTALSLLLLCLTIFSLGITSCGSVKTAQAQVSQSMRSTTQAVRSSIASLTGPDIQVVQVDPAKLKQAKSGREQMAAFSAKRRREIADRRAAALRASSLPLPDLDDPSFYSIDGLEPGAGMLPSKPES